jgi:NADPH-dependent 2,4-dienoyl-CoA reductase/sulfur reductase-like enzyme/rhodanese-related sulfurtransferase
MGKRIIVIGGVACGPKAAARLRRLDPETEITIVEQGEFISYAGCGLPYFVGGEVRELADLLQTPAGAARDAAFFKNVKNIDVLTGTRAERIDRKAKTVRVRDLASGQERGLAYDQLVIATGAQPIRPPFDGIDLDGVHYLTKIEDAVALRDASAGKKGNVVIVGAGLIGLESAEAFRHIGWDVRIVEMLDSPMAALLDFEFSQKIEDSLFNNGVESAYNEKVVRIEGDESGHCVKVVSSGGEHDADLTLIATGFKPNSALARDAGLPVGVSGGIVVDESMRTADPDIYAGGDCVECKHLVTGKQAFIPLGSTANKHGRVIGDNLAGMRSVFPGVLGTTVVKAFDLNVGRTGLTEADAKREGFDAVCSLAPAFDKAHYYPGSALVAIKIVADRKTGRVLGAQAAGAGDAARRIDVVATAISMGATVEQLGYFDLGYAPPFAQALDAVITAAHVAGNKISGLARGVSAVDVKRRIEEEQDFVLLDVRTPNEFAVEHIDAKQVVNLPLGKLRATAAAQLPRDKEIIALCKVSLRGYEAQRILQGMGFDNVKFMDGGMFAWPYPDDLI